jgi:putative DNA primase/helicase
MHEGKILYSAIRRKWIIWTGGRWEWDLTGKVQDLATETIKTMYLEAASHPEKDRREALSSHAIKTEARGKIESMLTLAQSMPEIRTDLERFDRHRFLFNCPNATVNLITGKARPHRREDYITKMSPTRFDGKHRPRFEKF